VAALLVIVYLIVWEPVQRDIARLQQDVESNLDTRQWMLQAAAEVGAISGNSVAGAGNSSGALLTVVERTAKSAGLGGALNRIEPQGRHRARVWLDQANFDAMLTWLATIGQQNGIVAESVVADPQDDAGLVNARLVLLRGGAS
jgi:general secretion pathway protein M